MSKLISWLDKAYTSLLIGLCMAFGYSDKALALMFNYNGRRYWRGEDD